MCFCAPSTRQTIGGVNSTTDGEYFYADYVSPASPAALATPDGQLEYYERVRYYVNRVAPVLAPAEPP